MRYPALDRNNRIQLELPRATSVLLVFDSEDTEEQFIPVMTAPDGHEIDGPWQVILNHINGDIKTLEFDELSDLTDLEETRHFAGEIEYFKIINIDSEDFQYIDLGDVQGVSELTVNGKDLGTRWYGRHTYQLGEALNKGENKIRIKLTTILGNHMKSLEDNPVAMAWTRRQQYFSMGIIGPVRMI